MPLSVANLSFAYRPERPILRDLTATFTAGRITALIGPNGAGKSTLLRCLLGVLIPQSGAVLLDGKPLADTDLRRRTARIAYIPQSPTVSEDFTVAKVVGFARFARRSPEDARVVADALREMALDDLANEPFNTLSAGQQQRVTLARAMAQLAGPSPAPADQAILADEPCSAMDPRHAMHAMTLLRRLADLGMTVVIVLHDFAAALRFAHRALVLDASGRVRSHAPIDEALHPDILSEVFGVGFDRLADPAAPDRPLALVPRPLHPDALHPRPA